MGCNGVYGLFGNGFMNPYLPMAGYLTSTLGHSPCNIWPARNWTQAAQSWTHCAAYPYGFNFNFTGRRTQYIVADPFQMPYQTALGLQTGQVYGGMSADQLKYCFEQRNERFVVDLSVTKTVSNLQQVKSIGACKDFAYMKAEENKELRDEVVALEKKAEELLKQFEEVMKDANSLGTNELAAKVKVYSENAKALVGESDELYKRVKEAEKAYNDKKTEEAAAAAEESAAGAGDNDGATKPSGGDETQKPDYTPPKPKTSTQKTEVMDKGTKVKVKNKQGEALSGKYYEYEGKIYKITSDNAKPIDVTDKVDKVDTTAS